MMTNDEEGEMDIEDMLKLEDEEAGPPVDN